jgi:prepilin peptidase CpaA
MGSWWITGPLALWALAVAVFDLKQRRVPNVLLVLVAVPAITVFPLAGHGLLGAGIGQSLIGLGIGALPYLPGYLLGKVGAGDVKFAGLQGFLLGGMGAFKAFLAGAVALGSIAVIVAIRKRSKEEAARLPAAVALAVGFLWVICGGYLMPGSGL